ncbi:hypothetical protein SESBI_03257 [Sesbania bispinosa]|nr:hypothetical protein SESBI_03257 [Sesbania bispinosa]
MVGGCGGEPLLVVALQHVGDTTVWSSSSSATVKQQRGERLRGDARDEPDGGDGEERAHDDGGRCTGVRDSHDCGSVGDILMVGSSSTPSKAEAYAPAPSSGKFDGKKCSSSARLHCGATIVGILLFSVLIISNIVIV